MLNTILEQSENLKLRGLLSTSQELLRKRQLKKALNNAQIAQDFAIRSGEAPGVALAAQLLIAEIYILNAIYSSDESLRHKGWGILENLDSSNPETPLTEILAEVKIVKAICLRRLGDFSSALEILEQLLPPLAEFPRLLPKAAVALVATHVQLNGKIPEQVLAKAEEVVEQAYSADKLSWLVELSLAKACQAEHADNLSHSIDYAHTAKRLAAQAENPELETVADLLLGKLSRRRGNNQIALRLLYDALDTAERIEYRSLLCDVQLQIGHVFEMLNNDREADKYFRLAEEAAANLQRPTATYQANLALGRSAHRNNEFETAGLHFSRALAGANECSDVFAQAVVLGEMAALKLDEGQLSLAQHLADEAVKRFALTKQSGQIAKTNFVLASLFKTTNPGDVDRLLVLTEAAVASARTEKKDTLLVRSLKLQAEVYVLSENFEQAYNAEKEASSLAMILLQQHRERQLPDLDMRAALRKKELEIEKLTKQNELKNAIVAKNEEIQRANQNLVQANEELRQFAYVASHDLKEPLRQIGSYVSLIKRNYLSELDEKGETFFGYVTEGVGRLNRLLDSLMHYTSIARLDNEISTVDLTKLIDSVQQELGVSIKAAGASISYDNLPQVETGAKLLRHVLFSLIDNAVKFRRVEESPVITISAQESDGMHILRIQDNGIGIDPEYQDKVFVLFQMLHAKSKYPGTGVGLAIAQKTIQRLGGRIWFESNEDGLPGTSFYISLPMGVEREISTLNLTEKAA